MRSSSADAEGEEDDFDVPDTQSPSLQNEALEDQEDEEDDEEDADAEDDQDDDEESEVVGPVKRAPTRSRTARARRSRDNDNSEDEGSGTEGDDDSDSSSEASSNNAQPWAGTSDTAEEVDPDLAAQNICVYVIKLSRW